MQPFKILAGGYDVFVTTYLFDPTTSSLSIASRSPTGTDCSWISQHPTNASILYATNETPSGALQSFTINSDGTLSPAQDTIPSEGDLPAFAAALSTGRVGVMNYDTGNGRIIPTNGSPLVFDESAPLITFPRKPGTVSHPHMLLEHGDEILVPDLGQDTIWRLVQNPDDPASFTIQGSIPQPEGSGPRHIAIFEDRLYTIHELSSTLTVQKIPSAPNGTSTIISDVSIVPPNPPAGASFAAAELLIPARTKRFPKSYIYASNRNIGVQDSRGDAIAIFEVLDKGTKHERLQLVKHVFTGLDQIRGMEFGSVKDGGEEFLMAAGVAGNGGTIVLKRIKGGRDLEIVARNLEIPTRTTFVWL
ncbi:hypothetical protein D9756_007265 [Leucocoprinus leucothites]|uniref:Isomerase YbhE n=1 Tax=Leucocoprinus leucothites TaxID=201217 RepID=A0A8H5D6Z7_9AGAR|nr:hypothetical protein D9756_007265 [Leucoagaricus leucothites]